MRRIIIPYFGARGLIVTCIGPQSRQAFRHGARLCDRILAAVLTAPSFPVPWLQVLLEHCWPTHSSGMPPDIDLVIVFSATRSTSISKQQIRQDARKAEQQYSRLIDTLTYAGLKAVGRRGESLGHLLVFVTCPRPLLYTLVKRERHSDFLSGLPVPPVVSLQDVQPMSPAQRIRIVHEFVTAMPVDGGLGVCPDAHEWDLIDSVLALHDRDFNETWVKAWTVKNISSVQLEKIREQFGDAIAMYFAFLSSYTRFLVFPAVLGLVFYFFPPYDPLYSILLSIWAIVFVEWWRIHERVLSLRFASRGSFRVEKRRAQYKSGQTWYGRELRILANIPVILLFAGILVALLTGIFVFEAFITQLYQGQGKQFISLAPTLLFVALVPRFMAVYQALAARLTKWENHAHQSTHEASLTLKTFTLSCLVAYMGLGLSAFVYVPFGETVMHWVQTSLLHKVDWTSHSRFTRKFIALLNGTHLDATTNVSAEKKGDFGSGRWDMDTKNAPSKLNPDRLRGQMFAYNVTNQVVNTFVEVGLPFVLRGMQSFRKNKHTTNGETKHLKRVVFEDEKEKGGMEERAFLDRVRAEVALPKYDLFGDYSEMVVQFGYVVLWSTIWPLAGVMAFLNNLFELRSDAFKMTVHHRRPIPSRTDTIGPWLDALTFLTWFGALTNSALVYLFSPELARAALILSAEASDDNATLAAKRHLATAAGALPGSSWSEDASSTRTFGNTEALLGRAVLVALLASHGYLVVRALVRHIIERLYWRNSADALVIAGREMKKKVLVGMDEGSRGTGDGCGNVLVADGDGEGEVGNDGVDFWDHDEGIEEIQRISKEA